MSGPTFIVAYLESLENVLVEFLTELKESPPSSPISASLKRNVFQLVGNGSLHNIERKTLPLEVDEKYVVLGGELSPNQNAFRRKYAGALSIWKLTGIHRKFTYHFCSVWGLICHCESDEE